MLFYTTSAIWFIEILPSIAFLHYSNCVFNWVDGQHAHALIGRIGKEKRELKTVHPCLGHLRFLYCIADTWFAIKNDNDTSVRAVVMLYVRIKTVLTLYHHFQHYKFMIRCFHLVSCLLCLTCIRHANLKIVFIYSRN